MYYSISPRSSFEARHEDLQDLSHLTAVARVKIVKESRKCDHDLRHWVGHANFLDHLTRSSTIASNQQKIFQFGFAAATAQKGSEPDVEIVEVEGDAPWSTQSVSKPRRAGPEPPKVSVVHCEVADDDEEDDLGMITRTISHHGTIKLITAM